MIPPPGHYRYELRHQNRLIAVETDRLTGGRLSGERIQADSGDRHDVEADLDGDGLVMRIRLSYRRGPFSRGAIYESGDGVFRGTVTAMAGRNAVQSKLGRFCEVDGDLLIFKALIIGHIRARGQNRWTGRVAAIDPATLVVASIKHTYHQRDPGGLLWSFEPRLGEREQIELDREGRIVRRIDARGDETVLASFEPAPRD